MSMADTLKPVTYRSELHKDWLERDEAVLATVLARVTDIMALSGEGSWIIDVDGNRWLDFASGIGVTSLGHCHPRVVEAIEEQAHQLIHTSVVAHHTPKIVLAEKLGKLAPFFSEPQMFFCNSGAEAVDGCLKLARQSTGKAGVIGFRRAFHGRTLMATSLTTAKTTFRDGYEPFMPQVTIAPYAYPLLYGGEAEATQTALRELDEILALQALPSSVGAMIVEPVLGEGGYVVPPRAWLEGLRERCDEHGILLVFDEVQCGMGRTGRAFAAETFGVTPDILLFGKAIASGMPLAGIMAPRDIFRKWPHKTHGTTFGGNPLSCVAASATIDVMVEEDLFARARELGAKILTELKTAASGNKKVREVRGIGLMIGIEMIDADAADSLYFSCLDAGLIVLTCGPDNQVVRLIPPLTLSDTDLNTALDILRSGLA